MSDGAPGTPRVFNLALALCFFLLALVLVNEHEIVSRGGAKHIVSPEGYSSLLIFFFFLVVMFGLVYASALISSPQTLPPSSSLALHPLI